MFFAIRMAGHTGIMRASLDKAARKARIEAVEVLGRRMDTYMDTTGRKKERGKNRHPEIVVSTVT